MWDTLALSIVLTTSNDFFPQFESYQVEKAGRNVNEAAKHLEEMWVYFCLSYRS